MKLFWAAVLSVAVAAGQSSVFAKRATEAREQNRIDEAIQLYKKALQQNTGWRDGWWFLGTLYYDQDRYAEGRDAFRRLMALDPKASPGWVMAGLCEFQTKEYDKARAHLEGAERIGVDPSSPVSDVARYHLAMLLTRNAQFEDASAILSQYARAGKDDPKLVEVMGIAALRKPLLPSEVPGTERELVMSTGRAAWDATARHATEAEADFKALLEDYPKQQNLHFLYGSFLMQQDPDQGLEEMKKELELSPNHLPALVSIAAEYLRRKEFNAGMPFAERATSAGPENFASHLVLGRLLCEGDLDGVKGQKELETAVKMAPGSPQARFALATAYSKAGRKSDAARERAEFLRLQGMAKTN